MIGRFGPLGLMYPDGSVAGVQEVTVYDRGFMTKPTIYSDLDGTVLANPLDTDALGNLYFYAEEGLYDLAVNGARIAIVIDVVDAGEASVLLDLHISDPTPHPAYDDIPDLSLIYQNGLL